ncbi:dihydrofolate reductase-like domain-containing protein [Crucibulum laeve]|uniref:2,5-diamino-6-ribosylamino-4(3H)-pyrimidinone 5'-phosphate reductase n=1 Tax=Crucibulum laeve TaxID=68775 RepID=A0A5C3MBI7_9AGAR|nr:dihydrofolate reductase-like domain-containing protein [Crucibulum laeve]
MTTRSPPPFLVSALSNYPSTASDSDVDSSRTRPFVTLTFAQSIDAKIAGENSTQLILSGKESMLMTHWMRTMHDAILIGIGTALNDDPQLNTRYLPPRSPAQPRYHLPRPVILDTDLRLPTTCKLLKNYQNGTGRRPWLICFGHGLQFDIVEWERRYDALEKAGAKIITLQVYTPQSKLPLEKILQALHTAGIRSVMIEGGARVIGSFFKQTPPVVDNIVVTVAPIFVGEKGISYGLPLQQASGFKHMHSELVGNDTVVTLTATN